MQFTPAQQQAIEARGQNVLVNAGAGAGKTRTLIERVFQRITDPRDSVPLDRMLIVTFTRAAAGEMKERLGERLRAEIAAAALDPAREAERETLERQLALIPRAQISTLHSFCLRLVRENSEAVGLPPDVDLMDAEEASLLHREMLEEQIEAVLAREGDGDVLRDLLRQLSPARAPDLLADLLYRLHLFLEGLADPEAFAAAALEEYRLAAEDPENCVFHGEVKELICNAVERGRLALERFVASIDGDALTFPSAVKYFAAAKERLALLQQLSAGGFDGGTLPPAGDLFKLPTRPRSERSAADADLRARSAGLKGDLDEIAKEYAPWADFGSMEGILQTIAALRPTVALLLGPLGLDAIRERAERHATLRQITFQQAERCALRILLNPDGTPTEAALQLRRELDEVLVDEFQDVNGLQSRLLHAVSRPGGDGGAGNLFVVGDVKQSIYRFRQADPRQFLELFDAYADYQPGRKDPRGARISLSENFRSRPVLLDELNRLFAALFTRKLGEVDYDAHQAFAPGRKEEDFSWQGPAVGVHLLELTGEADDAVPSSPDALSAPEEEMERDEREADYVARYLLANPDARRDCAILLQTSKGYATKMIEALRRHGIPHFTRESIGFLEQQEVLDVLALLRTIHNPFDEVALVGALRGPAGGWTEDDLARLRLQDRRGALFENLKLLATESGPTASRAEHFIALLREWQAAARREGMGALFGRIYRDLSLREKVATLPNGTQRVANLLYLMDRGVQFDSFRRKGIGQFLRFVQDLLDRDEDLGQPPSPVGTEEAVQVMTIHKSKGLQFATVIVPFLHKQFNFADANAQVVWTRDGRFAPGFRPGEPYGSDAFVPARKLLQPAIRRQTLSEQLRLLYVATTRAEERLLLVASSDRMRETVQNIIADPPISDIERHERALRALRFIDWVLLALSDRPELQTLDLETGEPTKVLDGGSLEVRFLDDRRATDAFAVAEADAARSGKPDIEPLTGELVEMLERVRRLSETEPEPALRVKLSATEAKRAFHSEDEEAVPVVRRAPAPPDALPDWWPNALRPAQETARSGAQKGTIVHRFFALAHLDAIAGGAPIPGERDRMISEGLLTEEEAALLPVDQVEEFFRDGLGQRVLENRARVRREFPFTARVRVGELFPRHPRPEETILFQGIADLLFTEVRGTEERLVLVDFKTDWWDGTSERLLALERNYAPQVALYRLGLERALGRPVDEGWLYFLAASQALAVEDSDAPDWRDVLSAAAEMKP